MRREVVEVLQKAGATAILVTHDQDEALSIADRVAVLQHGTVVQCDEPAVLYRRPVNAEVARFVGHANLLFGRLEEGRRALDPRLDRGRAGVADRPTAAAVSVLVRPEQVVVSADECRRTQASSSREAWSSAASSTATTCCSGSSSTSPRGGSRRPAAARRGRSSPGCPAPRRPRSASGSMVRVDGTATAWASGAARVIRAIILGMDTQTIDQEYEKLQIEFADVAKTVTATGGEAEDRGNRGRRQRNRVARRSEADRPGRQR